MLKLFFASRWRSFIDGGMPARAFQKASALLGITPIFYIGVRSSLASSPNIAGIENDLSESDCAIFYFGSPVAIKDPDDDNTYDIAKSCVAIGKPMLIYTARTFPRGNLASSGLTAASTLIDSEAEFESQLVSDFKRLFAH